MPCHDDISAIYTFVLYVWDYIHCIHLYNTVYLLQYVWLLQFALDLQSVETQLASVGNIMKSEHDIGTWMYNACDA